MSSGAAPPRGPGRPRSARADEAILQATLELLAERGLTALAMEAVAARAGVGKATLYRRWPSKPELVRAAIGRIGIAEMPVPDTGSVRDDFVAFARARQASARASRANVFVPRLIAEAANDPELRPVFEAALVHPARALVSTILQRGLDRSELRAGLDLEAAVDLLLGSLVYRLLWSGGDLSVLDELPGRLVDTALAGLGSVRSS